MAKPNVLMLHCHDLGDYIGCYPGNSARTPNLNKLAEEGVVFEQYFASAPTCSPSRGTMLTGLMPHRNGLMALASGGHWEVPAHVPTLPKLFQDAGYATANLGAWHISEDPTRYGVEIVEPTGPCEVLAPKAIDYLKNRSRERPFFLMVGFAEPHLQFTDRWPELQDPSQIIVPGFLKDHPVIRQEMVKFYGDASLMDQSVGQILECLKAEGLDEDTLVIFTGDHGPGLPLAKGTLYDPGIKISLIVRWAGRVQRGRRCPALAGNTDLLPTLLDAVGEADRIPDGLDGHSLWPFITDGKDVSHEHVFSEQTWHDFYEPLRALRTQRYKLIHNFHPGPGLQIAADVRCSPSGKAMCDVLLNHPRPEYELYDLASDPLERNNLAGVQEAAAIEADLKRKLNDWLEATGDPILKGVMPAPPGYMVHFMSKPNGPGGLPVHEGEEEWFTLRWPPGATQHKCVE